MKTIPFIVAAAALLAGCKDKKKEDPVPATVTTDLTRGLPSNPRSIHGYFYASCTTSSFSTGSNYLTGNFYAVFGDPARNLMASYDHSRDSQIFSANSFGNVSVGAVKISGYPLFSNPSSGSNTLQYFYSTSGETSSTYGYNSDISTEGNGSFKAIDLHIAPGYPRFSSPGYTFTCNKSQGFTINIGDFISNYDSVTVKLNSVYSSTSAKKTVDGGTRSVYFSPSDLTNVYTGTYQQISFLAYNYSWITLQDKVFVFEFSNKTNFYINIYP